MHFTTNFINIKPTASTENRTTIMALEAARRTISSLTRQLNSVTNSYNKVLKENKDLSEMLHRLKAEIQEKKETEFIENEKVSTPVENNETPSEKPASTSKKHKKDKKAREQQLESPVEVFVTSDVDNIAVEELN